MLKKIKPLTGCVSPGGEGHGFTWKDIKKHTCTRKNAQ